MKALRKLLTLSFILALLVTMVFPQAVSADTTVVTGTMPAGPLDHFVVTTTGPYVAGTGFTITVTAVDAPATR